MKYTFGIFTIMAILAGSCSNSNSGNNKQTSDLEAFSTPDSTFSSLFIRSCCGFTGGDGTYSVLLPDGRTVWIFGDTFLGSVNPDLTRERQTPIFIRNSFVVQDGDSLTTLHQVRPPYDASMIIPPAVEKDEALSEGDIWFWPGDGLIEEGKLKVFLSQFEQADTGMWGFHWQSTWLATFTLPEIEQESVIEIPYCQVMQVHYGHAILEEPDYTYVYGAHGGRPHAARYPSGDVSEAWEFFNGEEWTGDPAQSRPMGNMHASEQFTVLKIRDKYAYITQMDSFSTEICSFISETPYGPWNNQSLLYTTPIPGADTNLITYNAIAHPQFMNEEQILVSYNMNSFLLEDHFLNAGIYRPRFVWVPLKLMDPGF
ncbi:MAG: DUF5005 domain-containing protein [Bacteroidetes bacterium]|nr:DUF5005 domain-containing protein [Bacteroidota bacterium]